MGSACYRTSSDCLVKPILITVNQPFIRQDGSTIIVSTKIQSMVWSNTITVQCPYTMVLISWWDSTGQSVFRCVLWHTSSLEINPIGSIS